MKPIELLGSTVTPDGQRMTLSRRSGDYYIDVNGEALMSTRAPGSEQALADLAAVALAGKPRPHVLIGGLGMGFTLNAALDSLPRRAHVVVVEFFAAVVEWNREYAFAAVPHRMSDPRVVVEVADVVDYLGNVERPFDAILLDVDNAPDAWCMASNGRLYNRAGLERIRQALQPEGLLAIWSAHQSPVFEKHLAKAGFTVRSKTVRSRDRKGETYTIILGTRS